MLSWSFWRSLKTDHYDYDVTRTSETPGPQRLSPSHIDCTIKSAEAPFQQLDAELLPSESALTGGLSISTQVTLSEIMVKTPPFLEHLSAFTMLVHLSLNWGNHSAFKSPHPGQSTNFPHFRTEADSRESELGRDWGLFCWMTRDILVHVLIGRMLFIFAPFCLHTTLSGILLSESQQL